MNLGKNHRPIQSRDRQVRCGIPTESDIVGVPQKRRRSKGRLDGRGSSAGRLRRKPGVRHAPAPVVTVSKPLQREITEWDEYTGRFAPVATVEVRARVSGFINSIHFKDGEIVKQNDLLFTIDQPSLQICSRGKQT